MSLADRHPAPSPLRAAPFDWAAATRGFLLLATIACLLLEHGRRQFQITALERAGALSILTLLVTFGQMLWWARHANGRRSLLPTHWPRLIVLGVWLLGMLSVTSLSGWLVGGRLSWQVAVLRWSEVCVVLQALFGFVDLLRLASHQARDAAAVFVGSFLLLILVGTSLLMLPISRASDSSETGAPFLVALFTSTSACCVTGLTVVDTGTYWSRLGQLIILSLIQMGGLGMLTFGAFFAIVAPRGMAIRESVFLGNLFEARRLDQVRRLIATILISTLAWELCGAVLLLELWPDAPWSERCFLAVFHSVSAFCNAGFSLMPKNLEGLGAHWCVWSVIATLIIIGGLGFGTHVNLATAISPYLLPRFLRPQVELPSDRRLNLSSKLILRTTIILLIGGSVGVWLIEWNSGLLGDSSLTRILNAWFQSVTFRTAGFNAVDQAALHPGTKLLGIALMFIGGSPGSTAGGVKTVTTAILFLATWSLLRGRQHLEAGRRTIPDEQVKRCGTIMLVGLLVVFLTTMSLVLIENKPALFLDHLFEATSAYGTVGLSSVNTATLHPASQAMLVLTMFLGRVGPLTLLFALASRSTTSRFDYPQERVMLG